MKWCFIGSVEALFVGYGDGPGYEYGGGYGDGGENNARGDGCGDGRPGTGSGNGVGNGSTGYHFGNGAANVMIDALQQLSEDS